MIVELPKDADGREIPLDTKVLYDRNGFKNNVRSFMYVVSTGACNGMWLVRFTISTSLFDVSDMHLAYPDSWKRLLDDLDKAASKTYCGTCTYFGKNPTDCDTCAIGDITSCDSAAMRDIADRIRKLRGDGE